MLHDHSQDSRLQPVPIAIVVFGYGDEIRAKEDPSHLRQREQLLRQRRSPRRLLIGEIRSPRGNHRAAREEFQGCRVRRLLGLNEHRWLRQQGG